MMTFIFKQRRAVNLLFFILIILGLLALDQLGTAELPEIPSSGLHVSAVLPGASPEEMDTKVARRIQSAVKDISGVEEVTSQASESSVFINIKFVDGHQDVDALVRDVTQVINQVEDLPDDLRGPYVSKPVNRIFSAMTLVLAGGSDLARHNAWFEIEQVLKNIQQVEYIDAIGDRERRIEVQLDPIKLQRLGVRIDQVSALIRGAITDQSAGRMETFMSMHRMRIKAQPGSTQDIADLQIAINNVNIPISQLGEVKEVLEPAKMNVDYHGEDAWYINIYRREGSKIADLSEAIHKVVSEVNQTFSQQQQPLKLVVIQDQSHVVDRVLGQLSSSILVGSLLVLLILWCFFGFHNALYAAIGIPFAFVVTFIFMDIMGIGLNTFTLFGLVLVCGMVVDDTIVVLENVCSKFEQGLPAQQAIQQGVVEVIPAVLAMTGTTIAAFTPLLLMSGGMGDFLGQIPKVAILALVASLAECFVILPVHIYHRRHKLHAFNTFQHNVFNRSMDKLGEKMAKLAALCVVKPYRVMVGFTVLLFGSVAFSYWTMDFQLFDAEEVRAVRVHLTFPKTTDLQMTSRLLASKRNELLAIDQIDDVIILNGWNDYNYGREIKSHVATIDLRLEAAILGEENAEALVSKVNQVLATLPGLEKLLVVKAMNKPPVSSPVSIYLYGNDPAKLAEATDNIIAQLKSIPPIEHITNPLQDGIPELVFEVDQEMAAHYGLGAAEIGFLSHFAVTGNKITKVDMGNEILDVYVLEQRPQNWQSNQLQHVTLANGAVISLAQLGTYSTKMAPDVIKRFQGNRYIKITANINDSIQSNFKTHRDIERLVTAELLPEGISFEQLGEYSSTQKSLTSMIQSALLALGLVYLILAMLFKSYVQPALVLLTIPLAYIGVVWGMYILGRDISLFGLVGIIGLIGIVVNDSLVWVDCYNHLREGRNGEPLTAQAAAVQAVKQRFRAIMLTTLTTVLGLAPVALSTSAGIAGSMASTIVCGLIASSVMLLLFLPVCVVIIEDLGRRIREATFWRRITSFNGLALDKSRQIE